MLVTAGRGYGEIGRPVRFFEGYREWVNEGGAEVRESGSTSDFATYLSTLVYKVFWDRYQRVESNWRVWSGVMSVSDYKEITSVSLSGFPRLLKVREGGEFKDAEISEMVGPKIRVEKFGRLFSLTREAIINDDLTRFRDIPASMAEAAATSIAIDIVQNTLENPGNAYDGTAFFHTNHGNLLTAALSETSLASAVTAMRSQVDPDGYRINIRPARLIIPVGLEFTAARILNSTQIFIQGAGSTPAYGQGTFNVVQNIMDYTVEPYLSDPNDWYVFADPNTTRPAMQVAFLNNMDRPQIGLKNPEITLIMGGLGNTDPYTMSFEEIWWKVRWEWAARMWEWRSALKSAVT